MDRSHPFFSVILPTYNRRALLERALESVLRQTFTDFETIVVDDGSEDDTVSYLQGLSEPRLRVLLQGTNQGGSAARNRGIEAARGSWIAFLDSDDAWVPEKLQRFHDAILGTPQLGLWYSGNTNVNREGVQTRSFNSGFTGDHQGVLRRENPIGALPAVVVRSELAKQVGGFDESLPARQDMDFYYRVAPLTHFGFIPQMLTVVHSGAGYRISDSKANRLAGWLCFYRKHRKSMRMSDRFYYHKRIFSLAALGGRYGIMMRFLPGAVLGWTMR